MVATGSFGMKESVNYKKEIIKIVSLTQLFHIGYFCCKYVIIVNDQIVENVYVHESIVDNVVLSKNMKFYLYLLFTHVLLVKILNCKLELGKVSFE